MKKFKCDSCKKEFDIEKGEKIGKNKYCPSCYKVAENVESQRRHLIVVICEIFKISKPTGMMFSQMKQFHKKGLSYDTMRLTLQYLVAVENFKLDEKYGIGIVQYRYQDMIDYVKKQKKHRKDVELVDYKTNSIKLERQDRKNKFVEDNIIDINSIFGGC